MIQRKHIVADQLIIGVFDRNEARGRVRRLRVRIVLIDQFCRDNTCEVLLQLVVDADLQIAVNREVDIVAGDGLRLALDFHHMAHIVDIHGAGSLFAVQILLHVLFDARAAYGIAERIVRILFAQFL